MINVMQKLNAHFDGKSIVLDEPLPTPLQSGEKVWVTIEPLDQTQADAGRAFSPLNIQIDPALSEAIALDPEMADEGR